MSSYHSPVLSLMSQEGYRSSASATKMTEIIISQMTKSNTYIHFFVSKTLGMTCPETNFCPKFFSLADFLNLHFSNLFKRKCHQNPVAQLAGLLVPGHWAMVYNEAYQYQYCIVIPVDLFHKSDNAPVLYPTMHHFVTEMCTKWCIEGYLSNALWDL